MRTSVTLDPDAARLVADAVYRERTSGEQVINDALGRAFSQPPRREPYRLEAHWRRFSLASTKLASTACVTNWRTRRSWLG